jgi:hypothetical protein
MNATRLEGGKLNYIKPILFTIRSSYETSISLQCKRELLIFRVFICNERSGMYRNCVNVNKKIVKMRKQDKECVIHLKCCFW